MWITSDVDLPEDVLRAHSEHRLVIFAGAGVSAGSPSGLPLFDKLADAIGAEVGMVRGEVMPDVFLGRVAAATGADVHARVHHLLSTPTSKPNRLHRTLAQLALHGDQPRLVTTNYDRHLSRCSSRVRPKVPEFCAPALPLGDDFSGLVYLHGSLSQEPRQLVVTDADFGRAYLAQAWATRFLHGMFGRYVVLFVGYSHRDTIMTYLARGLPAGAARYVLTDRPDEDGWGVLNITPIGYDNPFGDHRPLLRALERWVALSRMGNLDHQQRIRQFAASVPSGDATDFDYMARALDDPVTVQMFADEVGEAWLDWAMQQPVVTTALTSNTATPSQVALCDWFGRLLAKGAARHGLARMQQLGAPPGAPGWFGIVSGLRKLAKTEPADVRPWLPLLLAHVPPYGGGRELTWLVRDSAGLASSDLVALLDRILTPRVELQPSLHDPQDGNPPKVRQEVTFDFEEHWIREVWEQQIKPRFAEVAGDLLPVLEGHLGRCHTIQVQAGQANRRHDPDSFRRPAVEPHPQNTSRERAHVLVDFARDVVEHKLGDVPESVAGTLTRWAGSDVPLLRRLAIHGWRFRPDVPAADKLRWLLERELLYDTSCKHELFTLLKHTVPGVPLGLARKLVRVAVSDLPPGDSADYELFNLMGWLLTARPDLAAAQKVLEKVRAQNPGFLPRPHPDLNWHMMTGWSGSAPPMSTEAFVAMLDEDPLAALAEVLKYVGVDPFGGGTSWEDALAMVTSASAKAARHGVALLHAIDGTSDEQQQVDLWRAVLNGWSSGPLGEDQWAFVLPVLVSCPLLPQLRRYVAQVLEHGTGTTGGAPSPAQLSELRVLAAQLWQYDALDTQEVDVADPDDWLGFALNAWGGMLAQFWVNGLVLSQGVEPAAGLDPDTSAAFESMLASATDQGGAARAILGSRLLLLFQVDEPWTVTRLLPEFQWTDSADRRPAQVWSGHLYWGGWHDRLLSEGLLEAYLGAQQPLSETANQELRTRYYGHLAAIALTSSIHPLDAPYDWLRRFLVNASTEARLGWADAVRDVLDQLTPEARELAWTSWMSRYWGQRLQARPLPLPKDEAGEMTGWLPHLGEYVPAAAELVLRAPATVPPGGRLWFDLTDIAASYPHEVARVTAHLLTGTEEPVHDSYQLRELVARLKPLLPADALRPLVEEALARGVHGAASWLA